MQKQYAAADIYMAATLLHAMDIPTVSTVLRTYEKGRFQEKTADWLKDAQLVMLNRIAELETILTTKKNMYKWERKNLTDDLRWYKEVMDALQLELTKEFHTSK